jgi:anaerobic selenocysteine-containing dehydrogenase
MVTGKPYPIRALTVLASNPLLSQPNTALVHQALTNLDLLVVLELFPTPTTALADYVLPMAGTLEQPVLQTNAGVANIAYGGTAALPPLFARRHNFYFWRDLGRRCGQQPYWPWETLEEALDEIFAPAGLNWQEFCRTGLYAPPRHYRKYRTQGFATPSGKVELYSAILEEMGYDPLPAYVPRNDGAEPYPLRLVTGVRCQPYYASELRQIAALRRRRPQPVAEMAAVTAGALRLADGDHVWIESPQGRIQQVLRLREMVPDTVSVSMAGGIRRAAAGGTFLGEPGSPMPMC